MARNLALTLLLTGLLFLAVSRIVTTGFARSIDYVARVFGPGRTRDIGCEFRDPQSLDARFFRLDGTMTPDSWWQRGKTVSFTLSTNEAPHPESLELHAAVDRDGDGHVTTSEWTALNAAPVFEVFGQSVSFIPPTHVDSDSVAYSVVVRYLDKESWCKAWQRSDLTYDDP
jgi:hypothetical protein